MKGNTFSLDAVVDSLTSIVTKVDDDLAKVTVTGRSTVTVYSKCQLDPLERIKIGKNDFWSLLFWITYFHLSKTDWLRWYVRLDLEESLSKHPDFFWMSSLLDKSCFLNWLYENQSFHPRELFGSFQDEKFRSQRVKACKFFFRPKSRPKRTIRHRGYRDKGTLPSSDNKARRQELENDVWLTQLQLDIEQERLARQDTEALIRGFLSG